MHTDNTAASWRAWPIASFLSLLVGSILLLNTGDASPWGIEWIILPVALGILTLIDLIPKRILNRRSGDGVLELPQAFEWLLWVHWVIPLLLVISVVLWRFEQFGANELVSILILVGYVGTGIALTIAACVAGKRREKRA